LTQSNHISHFGFRHFATTQHFGRFRSEADIRGGDVDGRMVFEHTCSLSLEGIASVPFDPNQCIAAVFAVIGKVMERVMSTYEVSFFKYLLNSDGHPFKCLQRRIDVSDAESTAQAEESASRAFEALCGYPWKLRADSIEVTRGRWLKP
jgi:hypothetical protein